MNSLLDLLSEYSFGWKTSSCSAHVHHKWCNRGTKCFTKFRVSLDVWRELRFFGGAKTSVVEGSSNRRHVAKGLASADTRMRWKPSSAYERKTGSRKDSPIVKPWPPRGMPRWVPMRPFTSRVGRRAKQGRGKHHEPLSPPEPR